MKNKIPANAPIRPIHYRVEVPDPNTHLFRVTLTIPQPAAQQRVSLPVWIPGSYLVREFSKNLQGLQARQGARTLLDARQLDKCSWQIECSPAKPLVISYEVYARDNSVRTAWLDAERGFFNGTSLCLRVEAQDQTPHALELPAPKSVTGWSLATGLTPQKVNQQGFGSYLAANYDELVDCPVEMGPFWSGTFTACGVPHRFVVAGAQLKRQMSERAPTRVHGSRLIHLPGASTNGPRDDHSINSTKGHRDAGSTAGPTIARHAPRRHRQR